MRNCTTSQESYATQKVCYIKYPSFLYQMDKKSLTISLAVSTEYRRVTDRRTHKRTFV